MPERKFSATNSYRYGFNGKELDAENPTQYDYGFRIYDPRLARFKSVDPLTPKYPELTPYQFASNRPIDGIDEDGLEYVSVNDANISSAETNKDGTYSLKMGEQTISASGIVSYKGQDYYNVGKNLYKTDKGISEQGAASDKITSFFVTLDQLKSIFPKGNSTALSTLETMLNTNMADYGIADHKALAHFLAQAGVETGGFKTLNATEDLDYTFKNVCEVIGKYDKQVRDDARYSQPLVHNPKAVGDRRYEGGYAYRGRGILQLTHKGNYIKFQSFYNSKYSTAINIVANPDLVQASTELAVLSGLHYFNTRVIKSKVDLSGTTNKTIDLVTYRVNGGYNAKQDRRDLFQSALNVLY